MAARRSIAPRNPLRGKFAKGKEDHVDAWLISYADLITLLFMFFVILVSATLTQSGKIGLKEGVPPTIVKNHAGFMWFEAPYDKLFGALTGTILANHADHVIALEKTEEGLWMDLSGTYFFVRGSADVSLADVPLLQSIAQNLSQGLQAGDAIEIESYTDDAPLKDSAYANNWELAAMRAARVTMILVEAGIDPARLHAVTYAANKPVVPNADATGKPIPENRDRNQRIIIRVQAKQP